MKNKVFFFVSSLYTIDRGRGGIAELINQLVPELNKKCNNLLEIKVISLFGEVEENTNFYAKVIQNKVDHHSDFSFIKKIKFWVISSKALVYFIFKNFKTLKKAKLVSTSPGPTFILSIFFRKVLVWENVSFFSKRKVLDLVRLLICKLSSSILIVPTKVEKERLSQLIFSPSTIYIPDWHDPEIISLDRDKDPSTITFMAAGMLEKRKGFDLLLKAFKKLDETFLHNIRLNIYGDGPQYNELNSFVEENGLKDTVTFKGFTQNLNKKYHDYDCFILSSRYEGFPLVMVNALASGMPVIAFDCETGPRDIISVKNGILVKNGNIDELSNAIVMFCENYKKRFLFEDCTESAKKYNLKFVINQWVSIFNN